MSQEPLRGGVSFFAEYKKLHIRLEMRPVVSPLFLIAMTLFVGVAVDLQQDLAWYDQHRIEQVVLLAVTAFGAMSVWRGNIVASLTRLPVWVAIAFGTAFGLGVLSAIKARSLGFAFLEWATLFLLVTLILLLADQARYQIASFNLWATRLVMALAIVISVKLMTAYLAGVVVEREMDTVKLFEGTFSNRRFFGQAASMILPLLAYPLLRSRLPRGRQASIFLLLGLFWMFVIVSGTRGTWVALALAAAVLAVFAWEASRHWLRVQLWALFLGGLFYWFLFHGIPGWIGLETSIENRLHSLAALNGREVLWSTAWVQIEAHTLLGIGPMHLATMRNGFGAHPHNSVLQLAAEWGIPAMCAFALAVAVGLRQLLTKLRRSSAPPNHLLVCLAASLLAAGAQSLVDGVIVTPFTQTLLALIVGWTLGVHWKIEVRVPSGFRPSLVASSVSVLLLFAVTALLMGIFPEVLDRPDATQAYVERGEPILPRFWGVGWIPGPSTH